MEMYGVIQLFQLFKTAEKLVAECGVLGVKDVLKSSPPRSRTFMLFCCRFCDRMNKRKVKKVREELTGNSFVVEYEAYKYKVQVRGTGKGIKIREDYDF